MHINGRRGATKPLICKVVLPGRRVLHNASLAQPPACAQPPVVGGRCRAAPGSPAMPMVAMASGVKTSPSVSRAMGASSRKETMVMMEKVLMESREPLPAGSVRQWGGWVVVVGGCWGWLGG